MPAPEAAKSAEERLLAGHEPAEAVVEDNLLTKTKEQIYTPDGGD